MLQFVRDTILRGSLGPGVPYVDWPWDSCSTAYLQAARTAKQCRERWANVLNPFVKHDAAWTREEMNLLIELHVTFGNKWREIAKRCPGRTTNKVSASAAAARSRQRGPQRRPYRALASPASRHTCPRSLSRLR